MHAFDIFIPFYCLKHYALFSAIDLCTWDLVLDMNLKIPMTRNLGISIYLMHSFFIINVSKCLNCNLW